MIDDQEALEEAKKNWAGVEALRDKLHASAIMSVMGGGALFPVTLSDAAQNLPMMHAFGVLNDVLAQLESEGHFKCKRKHLRPLVEASEKALCWIDFDAIQTGIDDRNKVAHEGELLSRGECWEHIDAVKAELSAWGVI